MKREILKKTGRIMILALSAAMPFNAWALEVNTEISASQVAVGESVILTIRVGGDVGDLQPEALPDVQGLEISFSGTERSYRNINGRSWRSTSLTFSVEPLRRGNFIIPPITVKAGREQVRSAAVKLTAVDAGRAAASGNGGFLEAVVEFSGKTVFAGEPLLARYYILTRGLEGLRVEQMERMPEAPGFVTRKVDEDVPQQTVNIQGRQTVKAHVYTFAFLPAESGTREIGGGSLIVSVEEGRGFFGMVNRKRLIFNTAQVRVNPLPGRGKPEDFSGNVGSFAMEVSMEPGEVKVFDEKKATITVKGTGNVLSMAKPKFLSGRNEVRSIMDDGKISVKLEKGVLSGTIDYTVTLVPEKPGTLEAGRFVLDFYDTKAGTYRKLESAPLTLTVSGVPAVGERTVHDGEKKKGPGISMILVAVALLIMALGFSAVIIRERRRFITAKEKGGKSLEDEKLSVDYDRLRNDVLMAHRRWNGDDFFRAVEALDGAIRLDGGTSREAMECLSRVKERLYAARFGGGSVTPEQMSESVSELKGAGLLGEPFFTGFLFWPSPRAGPALQWKGISSPCRLPRSPLPCGRSVP